MALLIATALRFVALGKQSLWTDELFSVYWAMAGAHFMFAHLLVETNPPLYYLILQAWMRFFGDSEAVIRLLSAFFSAATVPVVYVLGKNTFGKQAGTVAALLYALSNWNLFFAREARGYALVIVCFALALLCLHGITRELRREVRPLDVLLGPHGLGFLVAIVAGTYTNYIFIVAMAALGAVTTLVWYRPFACDFRFFTFFAIMGVISALLTSPIIWIAVIERHSASVAWIPRTSLRVLWNLALGTPEGPPWFGEFSRATSLLVWAPLFVYGAWHHRLQTHLFLVYLLPAVAFSLVVLISFVTPILLPRTTVWISIPIYVGLAGAIRVTTERLYLRQTIAGIVLLSSIVSAAGYSRYQWTEDWRSQTPKIAAQFSGPEDLVILGSDTPAIAFLYYSGENVVPNLRRWPSSTTAADVLDEYTVGIHAVSSDEIATAINSGRSLLFVSRSCAAPPGFDPSKVPFRPNYFCDGR